MLSFRVGDAVILTVFTNHKFTKIIQIFTSQKYYVIMCL